MVATAKLLVGRVLRFPQLEFFKKQLMRRNREVVAKLTPRRNWQTDEAERFPHDAVHISDAVARLRPWCYLLDAFYGFHSCFIEKTTNEDAIAKT